jgi:hypothetical protein
MEEAGAYKPELIQAIFDQGVSDCLSSILCDTYILPISGLVLKFLRNTEAVVQIFFHAYWRLRKLQK